MPFTVTDRTNPYTGKPLGLVQWGAPLAENHFVYAIRENGAWRWSEPVSRLIDGHAFPLASSTSIHLSLDADTPETLREKIHETGQLFQKTYYQYFLRYADVLEQLGDWKPQGD